MRRAARAALATTILAVSVAAAPLASAAPAQVSPLPVDCTTLAALTDPVCQLVEQIDGVLVPVEQATGDALAPVDSIAPISPAAPSGGETATPAPQPSSSPNTHATSTSSPTYADLGSAPASKWSPLSSSGASSAQVPDVPAGSTLELGPLALPSFGLATTPAVTGDQLAAAAAADRVLPAARAAAGLPDDSKATAVVLALSMLLLACGLLIDQVRKARLPIQF